MCAASRCPRPRKPCPVCNFKSGQIILQQPIAPEQMSKLLATGKTDLLEQVHLQPHAPQLQGLLGLGCRLRARSNFEFEASKYPARKTAAATKTQLLA